jgi:Arc/MetJ-type ribon-helix-helix transcriptional regulator
MKVKTSVSLSSNVVEQLRACTSEGNRSDFIEKAILEYFKLIKKNARDVRDLDIINAFSPQLNQEALDSLGFQAQL